MKPKKYNHRDAISRQQALKKLGKYAALTALGTFIILNPKIVTKGYHRQILVIALGNYFGITESKVICNAI